MANAFNLPLINTQLPSSGNFIQPPITYDDKYVGKASITKKGTWVYTDLILSLVHH